MESLDVEKMTVKIKLDTFNEASFIVLLGENLAEGICGFGKTLNSAIKKFDKEFKKEMKRRNIKKLNN